MFPRNQAAALHEKTMEQFTGSASGLQGTPAVAATISSSAQELASLSEVSLERQFAQSSTQLVDLEYDATRKALWLTMTPEGRPCFSPQLLEELAASQATLTRLYKSYQPRINPPVAYKVISSDAPEVFNLGGDLALFMELIKAKDKHRLAQYAKSCINVIYRNHIASNLPVVTIALVQGDALGGGFETALSCDMIVAEEQAKFGLPEVLFNLFPGMGAYSFLARKIGHLKAEEIISSGRLYSASELHDMGLVHKVVATGRGRAATAEIIEKQGRRHNAQAAIYAAGKRVNPVHYEELIDIVSIWVDAAMNLGEADTRKMARLVSAQNRRAGVL